MTKASTAATKPRAPRAPRKTKKPAEQQLSMNMGVEVDMSEVTGDPALDALMAELNGVGLPSDEIVLPSEPEHELVIENAGAVDPEAAEGDHTDDDLLAAAVSGAEMLESYDADGATDPLSMPVTDAEAPKAAEAADAAPGKEKKARAPKAPKEPKEPRTFYGLDKLKRLSDRGVAAVMLKSEEDLSGDDLAAAQQRTLDVVAKANQKVKNRTSNILEFVTGTTGVLNNLIRVCFNLVETTGALTTGEKGNMWATMSVCYGAGTIRSGGNNSVAALRDLQVIIQNGKGEYIRNPESALYERIQARLAGAAESVPVAEESLDIESAPAPVEAVEPVVEATEPPAAPEVEAETVAEIPSELADAVA